MHQMHQCCSRKSRGCVNEQRCATKRLLKCTPAVWSYPHKPPLWINRQALTLLCLLHANLSLTHPPTLPNLNKAGKPNPAVPAGTNLTALGWGDWDLQGLPSVLQQVRQRRCMASLSGQRSASAATALRGGGRQGGRESCARQVQICLLISPHHPNPHRMPPFAPQPQSGHSHATDAGALPSCLVSEMGRGVCGGGLWKVVGSCGGWQEAQFALQACRPLRPHPTTSPPTHPPTSPPPQS